MLNCRKEYDIDRVCRCCLNSSGEMKPLYGFSLDKMLCNITGLQVEPNDGLPEHLCFQCVLQLSRAFRFKEQCIRSDSVIRDYIKNQSNKNELQVTTLDSSDQTSEAYIVITKSKVDNQDSQVEYEDDVSFLVNDECAFEDEAPKDTHCNSNETPFSTEFMCEVCEKQFTTKKQLVRHLKIHDDNKPNKCPECDKSFAEKCNLKKHMLKHTGELRNAIDRPHLCSICGNSFKYSSSLSKHMKFHTGKNLHHCPHCPKFYVEKSALTIHMRCHTGERPHSCPQCNQRFSQICNLRKHLRTHTGERPFTCPICGRSFAERDYLPTHIQTHNTEKNSLCSICGKRFTTAKTLDAHMRTHAKNQRYPCEFKDCHKTFTRMDTMRIHRRIHSGEKPYACDICSHTFTTSTQLSNHMRTHTGEKPFSCKLCPKKFASRKSLRCHSTKHEVNNEQDDENFIFGEAATEQIYEESVLLFKINENGELVPESECTSVAKMSKIQQ